MSKMKNTKFKIEMYHHNKPQTVTTFTNLRLHKLIQHIKFALLNNLELNVYISYCMKCGDGTWSWRLPDDLILKSSFVNKNYTFFTWDDYSTTAKKHIKSYEKPLRRAIKWI